MEISETLSTGDIKVDPNLLKCQLKQEVPEHDKPVSDTGQEVSSSESPPPTQIVVVNTRSSNGISSNNNNKAGTENVATKSSTDKPKSPAKTKAVLVPIESAAVENDDEEEEMEVDGTEVEEDLERQTAEATTSKTAEKQVNGGNYCLICGANTTSAPADGQNQNQEMGFDSEKYEKFLAESLHVQMQPMKVLTTIEQDSEGNVYEEGDDQSCMNFCAQCQQQVTKLYELHGAMKEAVRKYEEERDKVALDIVTTFLAHTKPIDDFPLEMHRESVAKSEGEFFEITVQFIRLEGIVNLIIFIVAFRMEKGLYW